MAGRYPRGIITSVGKEVLRGGRHLSSSLRQAAAATTVPSTRITRLPSGMRVATENTNMPTATVGVFIDAGSRYEVEQNNGTAHFLEHMAFKGTSRRTRYGLELEVENMGAHLNAYTSREQTVYYAKCFAGDLERSVDILSDILLHSQLQNNDIQAERAVILREAEEVAQNYQEVVFDELHMAAFHGTPLAFTILGSEHNIKTISRKDLVNYIKTHYKANRMVIAASGGVDHQQVVDLASKYFGELPSGSEEEYMTKGVYTPCEKVLGNDKMRFVAGAVCVEGASWTHADNLTMMIANTILGEWDRSRGFGLSQPNFLQMAISEIEGARSFLAFNTCYKDTGLLGVYYVADAVAVPRLLQLIIESWQWLANDIDEATVERGKRTLLTNLLLMLDGSTPVTEDMGRQLLCYGRRIPVEELKQRIQAVTVDSLRETCRRRLLNCKLATMAIGDIASQPKNSELEKLMK